MTTPTTTTLPLTHLDIITNTLSDHERQDHSRRTYSCLGCFHRHDQHILNGQLTYDQQVYKAHQNPGWTIDEYNNHVADHIRMNLSNAGMLRSLPGPT